MSPKKQIIIRLQYLHETLITFEVHVNSYQNPSSKNLSSDPCEFGLINTDKIGKGPPSLKKWRQIQSFLRLCVMANEVAFVSIVPYKDSSSLLLLTSIGRRHSVLCSTMPAGLKMLQIVKESHFYCTKQKRERNYSST